jgi:hypothetical protein
MEEETMSDPLGKVTEGKDIVGKIQNFLAGFIGYIDRERRRDADKLLRETVAQRYEEQWDRISELQRQFVSEGAIESVDDLEAAAIKLRGDAVRVHKEELESLYEYDLALLEGVDKVSNAIDNIASSVGTDGLPAAIRNLVTICQEAVDIYNRRDEVILATGN